MTSVTFGTKAPSHAPETKGNKGYFHPEHCAWKVDSRGVSVIVSGPTTRPGKRVRWSDTWWNVGGQWGHPLPEWLVVPQAALDAATEAVRKVDALTAARLTA